LCCPAADRYWATGVWMGAVKVLELQHGITELSWRGPLKAVCPTPCTEQGHPQLHQCSEPIQPDLGCLQGWGTTASLGYMCQCLTTLSLESFFLTKHTFYFSIVGSLKNKQTNKQNQPSYCFLCFIKVETKVVLPLRWEAEWSAPI